MTQRSCRRPLPRGCYGGCRLTFSLSSSADAAFSALWRSLDRDPLLPAQRSRADPRECRLDMGEIAAATVSAYFIADEWPTSGSGSRRRAYPLIKILLPALTCDCRGARSDKAVLPRHHRACDLFLAIELIGRWSYATRHPLPGALANGAVFVWAMHESHADELARELNRANVIPDDTPAFS